MNKQDLLAEIIEVEKYLVDKAKKRYIVMLEDFAEDFGVKESDTRRAHYTDNIFLKMNEIRNAHDPKLPLLSSIVMSDKSYNGICKEAIRHEKISIDDERLSTVEGMKKIQSELQKEVISFYKKEGNQ